jgi:hypothetical protein
VRPKPVKFQCRCCRTPLAFSHLVHQRTRTYNKQINPKNQDYPDGRRRCAAPRALARSTRPRTCPGTRPTVPQWKFLFAIRSRLECADAPAAFPSRSPASGLARLPVGAAMLQRDGPGPGAPAGNPARQYDFRAHSEPPALRPVPGKPAAVYLCAGYRRGTGGPPPDWAIELVSPAAERQG